MADALDNSSDTMDDTGDGPDFIPDALDNYSDTMDDIGDGPVLMPDRLYNDSDSLPDTEYYGSDSMDDTDNYSGSESAYTMLLKSRARLPWQVIDNLSLEAACIEAFEIPIAAQAGIIGAVETPSRERSIEEIDIIVAIRDQFVAVYSRSHRKMHESESKLRQLDALRQGIHHFHERMQYAFVETSKDNHRKAMVLAGDVVAWLWRLKMALWREVKVASESMDVRMEAQAARQQVQAEGRQCRA